MPRKRGVKATVASSPLGSSRQGLVRGVQIQHGSKSTIAIGFCCTPKNGPTWHLSAVVRSGSKASETASDHPQQPAIVRSNPIDLVFVLTCRTFNPRVADEAVYVVNASRVRVHGMEGNDITCLICHSGGSGDPVQGVSVASPSPVPGYWAGGRGGHVRQIGPGLRVLLRLLATERPSRSIFKPGPLDCLPRAAKIAKHSESQFQGMYGKADLSQHE